MDTEREWAEHMPSEGEDPAHAERQRSPEGLRDTVKSPEYQKAASAAPDQADPDAAEHNREFVEDIAMEYDRAEEEFAQDDQSRQ